MTTNTDPRPPTPEPAVSRYLVCGHKTTEHGSKPGDCFDFPETLAEARRRLPPMNVPSAADPMSERPLRRVLDDPPPGEPLGCGYFASCDQDANHDGPHTAGMYPEWQVPTIEPLAFIAPPSTTPLGRGDAPIEDHRE